LFRFLFRRFNILVVFSYFRLIFFFLFKGSNSRGAFWTTLSCNWRGFSQTSIFKSNY